MEVLDLACGHGRIANRLDLMGPAYTIDAACASSLSASPAYRATQRHVPGVVGGLFMMAIAYYFARTRNFPVEQKFVAAIACQRVGKEADMFVERSRNA